jgi:3-oxoacyl-[acyl-carrier protein] reductase
MSDRYQQFADSRPGRLVVRRLGLPQPTVLRRHEPGAPLLEAPALLGAAPGGRLAEPAARVLAAAGAEAWVADRHARRAADDAGLAARDRADETDPLGAALFDASGIAASEELRAAYEFFHAHIRQIAPSGRLLVLGTSPGATEDARAAVAQRALEGFVRSAAKELRGGATGQLVRVAPGAEANAESTLRFLLSARSAYVSGQVIDIGETSTKSISGDEASGRGRSVASAPGDWDAPLAGKVALVTGAARGIGAAIAEVLARDGAHVVCLDVPAQGAELAETTNRVRGTALQLDITAEHAPGALVDHLRERHGGVDVVVHNAGITRDKTLGRMSEDQWDSVLAVNLTSPERLTAAILDAGALRRGGRVVCVASVSGIAGNRGQVNYATSKAGVIGLVEALAPELHRRQATINAVAPGFVETRMTAAMPVAMREAGRRMNSLAQGGQPIDVAETVAWLASPGSGGVNGSVVRVCGQSLIGA